MISRCKLEFVLSAGGFFLMRISEVKKIRKKKKKPNLNLQILLTMISCNNRKFSTKFTSIVYIHTLPELNDRNKCYLMNNFILILQSTKTNELLSIRKKKRISFTSVYILWRK